MKFTLPEQLPAIIEELEELANQARAEINVFQARAAAGEELNPEATARLEYLVESFETVKTARDEVAAAEQSNTEKLSGLLDRAATATAPAADDDESDGDQDGDSDGEGDGGDTADTAEPVAEAEAATAEAADKQEPIAAAATGAKREVSFAGAAPGGDLPADKPGDAAKGWELLPSSPKFAEFGQDKVGFAEIAKAIASVNPGQGTGRQRTGTVSMAGQDFATQAVARLVRPQETPIEDPHDVYPALARLASQIPGHGKVSAAALTAAGGWCAPSEQVYTFCAVPPAADLISLPDFPVSMDRGGVRFPVNPDVSALLDDLFHFTETELEAVTGSPPEPTAVKPIIELPCPDEFIEYRLEAIGWAAKAGILQRQAWPESIENALEQIQVAHQHRVSQLSIGKMVAGSGTVKVVPTDTILGTTSSVLNGLALQASNLRYNKGLSGDATIEGVAPVWFREVLRADLALRDGLDALAVTNAQIDSLLSERGIYLQYVSDWQTRGSGQPGNMATDRYPGFADVLLFPAGTWFRSLNGVITLGVQYPLQQLVLNQYTHIFTEDSFQVGKRCDQSIIVRVPLCQNGAIGAREEITCGYVGTATLTATLTVTGAPTGGSFPLAFTGLGGKSATIAWNSTNAQAKTVLAAMDDNLAAADFTVTGGALPATPLVITYPAVLGTASATGTGLTGGTTPAAAVT